MTMQKKFKISPLEIALLVLLIIQFGLIAYCNLTLTDINLDCDNAKMFRHIVEMWRNKKINIPNWNHVSTLELDCASLFALPIYGLTQNIFLSYGLSNIILTAIFIAILFFLFQDKPLLYPLLCANFICIPYRIGMLDYFNMLFFCGSQYIIKSMVPILLVALLLYAEKKELSRHEKIIYILFDLFYLFLILITNISSGSYVTLCGLFPILLIYLGIKFFSWKKMPPITYITLALTALLIVIGLTQNRIIMSGTRVNDMSLCAVTDLWVNISSCFFGFFELFGGLTALSGITVLSYEGVCILAKWCFVFILLFCAILALAKCIKKQADLRTFLLMGIFLGNYIILNLTQTRAGSDTYEYRYHLIGAIPLICVACIFLLDSLLVLNKIQQGVLFCFGYSALLFICGTSFHTVFTQSDPNKELKELASYCSDLDLYHVYMYKACGDSEICRILDLETQYVYIVDDNANTLAFDYYNNDEVNPENSIIAVDNTYYNLGDTFTLAQFNCVKFAEVANRSLYHFDYIKE